MNDDLSTLDDDARALLEALPAPLPGAEARIQHKLARSLERERRPSRAVWAYAVAGASTFAAAAAVLLTMWWPSAPPTQGVGALASEEAWAARQFEGVSLSYRGVGDVEGARKAPRIEWQRGVLNVEVTPDRGLDVQVQTREAEVRVVGTGFTVTRDALGTRVEVRHGVVETRCVGGEVQRLEQGDVVTCAPESAAGLLGRAQALRSGGAPGDEVLSAIAAGRARAGSGAVADELDALRVQVLADQGRPVEALAAARAALEGGATSRRAELIALSATLARPLGGCAMAAPWLVTLGDEAEAVCN